MMLLSWHPHAENPRDDKTCGDRSVPASLADQSFGPLLITSWVCTELWVCTKFASQLAGTHCLR